MEGWETWRLAEQMSGQLRLGPRGQILGLDLGAGLALARAHGFDERAVSELLPAVAAGLVAGIRKIQAQNE